MRQILTIAAVMGMLPTATPLHARDVLRLQASSPWNVHYADDSCRLLRTFGKGDNQVTLVLDQFAPGDEFKVMFVGKPVSMGKDGRYIDGELRFGPIEREADIHAVGGAMGDNPALFISAEQRIAPLSEEAKENSSEEARRDGRYVEVPPIGPAREAAVTWLQLTGILRDDLVIETGPMDKPLAALRECSWDTVKMWGFDVEQQKSLTRDLYPKTETTRWIDPDDYPTAMIRGGYQGTVNYRLMVDETGKPTSCHIQASTRPKEFDDIVCSSIMKRARFVPALDAQGKPVPSYWRQTVQFRICC